MDFDSIVVDNAVAKGDSNVTVVGANCFEVR